VIGLEVFRELLSWLILRRSEVLSSLRMLSARLRVLPAMSFSRTVCFRLLPWLLTTSYS
jgi:hypothetical protein